MQNEKNFYPFNHRNAMVDGNRCVVGTGIGHFCGYVAIPANAIPKQWQGDYNADGLQFLAIHGGITYAAVSSDGDWAVFGFDCAHAGDESNASLRDPEFVMALTRQMEDQIHAYAAVIQEWRAAPRERKIEILQSVIDKADNKVELGFGAMIEMMAGAPVLDGQ